MMETMIVSEDYSYDILWETEESSSMDSENNPSLCGLYENPSGPIHLQRSTRVRFAESVQEHKTISLNEFSDCELEASWYSSTEKKGMAAKRKKIVSRLERGQPRKQDQNAYRGLECWTLAGAEDLNENINTVITAVMDEQNRQWTHGIEYNAKLLALKSQEVTGRSVQRALEIAQCDESEAKRFNKGEDQEEFTDGISWYRPHKRGNRRGFKGDVIGSIGKPYGKSQQKSWRTAVHETASRPSSNQRQRRWVKGNRGRMLL